MANILVLGVGPLPFEPSTKLHAPGLRTWQFAELLSNQKHHVTIGLIQFGDFQERAGLPEPTRREDLGTRISVVRMQYHPAYTTAALSTLHRGTRFSCVVSTTDIMNSLAAGIPEKLPLWLDYNGDPFAEKQLQGMVHRSDDALLPQWKLYLAGLLAGDRFSCASTLQKYALVGQLGFAGRLNQHSCGEDIVHVMPNCSRAMERDSRRRQLMVKGHLVPATAFLVVWTGGYNTWSDPDTLFHGLELAIEADPSIYFASTGGAIAGHDNETFRKFENLVESSRHREHYHFLGWRSTDEVASIYEQADAAISVDRYSVEAELGTRTRIIDWLQFRVPVVTTNLCELTHQLNANDLIYPFNVGSPEGLRNAILRVKEDSDAAAARADRAQQFFDRTFSEDQIFQPMLEWAAAPVFAADREIAAIRTNGLPIQMNSVSRLAGFHKDVSEKPISAGRGNVLERLKRKLIPGR